MAKNKVPEGYCSLMDRFLEKYEEAENRETNGGLLPFLKQRDPADDKN